MSKRISVTYIPIEKIKIDSYNPRRWSQAQLNHLMRSIDRFGMLDALIINVASGRKFVLIGGHMRLAALKALGYKEVPVVFVDIPDIEKEKELNIRLNANTGSWDIDLLKDLGIDILTKADFDCGEIDGMFNDVLTIEDDEFDVAKELEKIKEPKAKEGDHYLLGKHHLICGDSTNPEVVKKVTDGTQIDMINSDSPYNIKLNYNKGIGTKGKYGATKCNDNKSDTEYRKFLKTTLSNGLSVCKKDAHIFYWCDQKYIGMIQDIYAELGINFKRVCLWIKNSSNPTPQIAFNKCYEPCVYGITGKPYLSKSKNFSEILNKEIDSGNRTIDDILDLLDIWLVKRLPTTTYEHPTSKPPSLYEKALRRCSKPGDAVLDLFGGSGSQLIACEQLKRICYMVELDPVFIDLIINRYEKLTGQKSRKLN